MATCRVAALEANTARISSNAELSLIMRFVLYKESHLIVCRLSLGRRAGDVNLDGVAVTAIRRSYRFEGTRRWIKG